MKRFLLYIALMLGALTAQTQHVVAMSDTTSAFDKAEKDVTKEQLRNPVVQGYSLSGRLTIKGTRGKKNPAMVWTVTLTDCDSLVLMITVTDQNGEYRFDNLPSGSYKVSFIEPLGLKRVYQVKLKNKDKAFNQTSKEDGSDYASQAQRHHLCI